jgi:hypothetical protein
LKKCAVPFLDGAKYITQRLTFSKNWTCDEACRAVKEKEWIQETVGRTVID